MSYFNAQPGERPSQPAGTAYAQSPEASQSKETPYFVSRLGPCPDAGMIRESPPEPPVPTSAALSAPGVYILETPARSAAETLAAIDQALRCNSARVAVNGLFDLD